jgi:hypothetical protein
MGEWSVSVRNVKAVESALGAMAAKVENASRIIVSQGGALIEREAKQVFRPRPNKSEVHRNGRVVFLSTGANAPRKPRPTSRSGLLRGSITTAVDRVGNGRWMSRTGPTVKYGRNVESGKSTTTKSYAAVVEDRGYPFMDPAFEKAKPRLSAIYREQWKKALS